MHQTVPEFFLRPHNSVIQSVFKVVSSVQQARNVIQTTCAPYTNLHYQEVIKEFQQPDGDWNPELYHEFVQYLDSRPFIEYSLEFLTAQKNNHNRYIQQFVSDLTRNLQNYPPSIGSMIPPVQNWISPVRVRPSSVQCSPSNL
jgi:hypothetical protein